MQAKTVRSYTWMYRAGVIICNVLLRLTRTPPARWVCRPPKAGETTWDGTRKRTCICPVDSALDHWVCEYVKPTKLGLHINWTLHKWRSRCMAGHEESRPT